MEETERGESRGEQHESIPRQDDGGLTEHTCPQTDIAGGIGPLATATASTDPATRVVVRCFSHKMPGPQNERLTVMANLICRHHWGRDWDKETDGLRSLGLYYVDATRVRILVDVGTLLPGAVLRDVPVLVYRWNGKKLQVERVARVQAVLLTQLLLTRASTSIPRQLTNPIRDFLDQFPFKYMPPRAPVRETKSLQQLHDELSTAEWDNMMEQTSSMKIRTGRGLCNFEADWLEQNPDKFDMIMQQIVSRRRWYKLEVLETERVWIASHPTERADSESSVELIRSVVAATRRRNLPG